MHSYKGPFKNYPQVTVYHPNKGNGHDFANVGWTGWIGSITGEKLNSTFSNIMPTQYSHPKGLF